MSSSTVAFLVVCDVDSTLFNEEGIDLIAVAAGPTIAEEVAAITSAAMAGEMDFAQSLRARVRALRGLKRSTIEEISSSVTPTQGARELIHGVHLLGGKVCAVSGGFHEVIDPLASELGLDQWMANRFEWEDGVLTGNLLGPIIDSAAKKEALEHWAHQWGVPRTSCVAVGDGANDLEMIEWAGLGIGFVPKKIVAEHADLVITSRDLSLVLPHLPPRI